MAALEAKRTAIPTWPRNKAVAATVPACVDLEEQARVERAMTSLRARKASKEISNCQFAAYAMMVRQGKREPPPLPVRAVVPVMVEAEPNLSH